MWARLLFVTAGLSGAAAHGCTSFGATSGEAPDATAPDAAAPVIDAAASCNGSGSLAPKAMCRATSCAVPKQLYPGLGISRIVVRRDTLYAAVGTEIRRAKLPDGVLESWVGLPAAAVSALAADDSYVYASTATGQLRFTLAGEASANAGLLARPGILGVGSSFLFVLAPSELTRVGKNDRVTEEATLEGASALSVAGDDAFWISVSPATTKPIVAGPFPRTEGIASEALPGPKALVASPTRLFVALANADGSGTRIVSVARDKAATVTPLVAESGAVRTMSLRGDVLYWVADRASESESLVLGRYDLCRGEAKLIGSNLFDIDTLSIDGPYVYAFATTKDFIYRFDDP